MERFTRLTPKTPKRLQTSSTPTSPTDHAKVKHKLANLLTRPSERKALPRRTSESSNAERSEGTNRQRTNDNRDSFSNAESDSSNKESILLLPRPLENMRDLPLTPSRLTSERPELALPVPQTSRREGLKPNPHRPPRPSHIKAFGSNALGRSDAVQIQRINDDNLNSSSNSESRPLGVDSPNKSSTEGISDEALLLSFSLQETNSPATLSIENQEATDVRGRKSEIRNVKPAVQRSAKRLDKIINPRTKKALRDNAQSSEISNAGMSSPRQFPGLAELPTYSPKRAAFTLEREVNQSLTHPQISPRRRHFGQEWQFIRPISIYEVSPLVPQIQLPEFHLLSLKLKSPKN